MATVRDLIKASLLDLGAIASGESPTADEAADSLNALNNLLESWRLESLLVYAVQTVTLTLTGATSYTWGTGGTINQARPVRLEKAAVRLATDATLDLPVAVLTDEEYESIALKGITSTLAYAVYLDRAFPLAHLYTWPVQSGGTLLLYPWTPLSAFASLDTTIALPPGYTRALQKNLSLELAPQYRDCQITEALALQARDSKAALKTINSKPRYVQLPAGLPTGRSRTGTDRAGFLSGWSR